MSSVATLGMLFSPTATNGTCCPSLQLRDIEKTKIQKQKFLKRSKKWNTLLLLKSLNLHSRLVSILTGASSTSTPSHRNVSFSAVMIYLYSSHRLFKRTIYIFHYTFPRPPACYCTQACLYLLLPNISISSNLYAVSLACSEIRIR